VSALFQRSSTKKQRTAYLLQSPPVIFQSLGVKEVLTGLPGASDKDVQLAQQGLLQAEVPASVCVGLTQGGRTVTSRLEEQRHRSLYKCSGIRAKLCRMQQEI